ncbi:hypothetical protein [Streptomyces sp. Ac-502]|uniref:hypothetical protein n=1 Tax=Streptomyces sp. Ac-502 TaxID=3342801 RepID=UPI003862505B
MGIPLFPPGFCGLIPSLAQVSQANMSHLLPRLHWRNRKPAQHAGHPGQMKGFSSMVYLPLPNRPSPPDLAPVRDAIQSALNDADEAERPGLRRALDIVNEFTPADGSPATEEWARKALAVAGVDPRVKEIKAIQALRTARPSLGMKEATALVRSLRA